jgi:hypothetical protein
MTKYVNRKRIKGLTLKGGDKVYLLRRNIKLNKLTVKNTAHGCLSLCLTSCLRLTSVRGSIALLTVSSLSFESTDTIYLQRESWFLQTSTPSADIFRMKIQQVMSPGSATATQGL